MAHPLLLSSFQQTPPASPSYLSVISLSVDSTSDCERDYLLDRREVDQASETGKIFHRNNIC